MPGVITQAVANSFKQQLTVSAHDFTVTTGDVFKLSLLKTEATLTGDWNASSTVYASGEEPAVVNGIGYTAGGVTLTNITPTIDTGKAVINFNNTAGADIVWTLDDQATPTVSLGTQGCIIYNTNATVVNSVLGVWEFSGPLNPTGHNATLTITLPATGVNSSLLRIA